MVDQGTVPRIQRGLHMPPKHARTSETVAPGANLELEACLRCPARPRGFCAEFTADELAEIAAMKLPARTLPPRTEIYHQGEHPGGYYAVLAGWVALRIGLEDGSRHIFDFALPGAFLGIVSGPAMEFSHAADCITEVRICELPRAALHQFVDQRPRALERLLHITACHAARAQDHFTNLSGRDARDRLAHLLVELFFRARHRLPVHAGDSIAIPLTQVEIGEAIGLTSVHVSRMFSALREDRIIRFAQGTLTVLDPPRLLAAAGSFVDMGDYGRDGLLHDAPATKPR